MKFLAAIAIAACALALSATVSTAGSVRATAPRPLGMVPHLAARPHTQTRMAVPAQRTTKGATFVCGTVTPATPTPTPCTDYAATINQYFTDVAAGGVANATDNVYSVTTQYFSTPASVQTNIQYNETFAGSYNDGNPFPTTGTCHDGFDKYCVTNGQLTAQIAKVIAANHLPMYSKTSLYFIFTPANVGVCIKAGTPDQTLNPCTTNVFCAYHSVGNGFLYAVEPDAQAIAGGFCDPGQAPAGNSADATINTVSHEHIEAITDPFGLGWISGDSAHNNPEIGDLCAYDFGTTPSGSAGSYYNQTINGHNYYLQYEYSNAANSNAGGCVGYLGGASSPSNPLNGSGPLVYNGGDVMTTNTVYAIYWIPAAPANTKLPTISGTTKVGKKLKVSNGKWSNQPKFTYRWLRCSSRGTSCKGIAKATGGSYTLAKADAGHRLEVRVTGTNMVSGVSVTSGKTAVVKK